jgi:hypothetical protein
VDNKRPTNQHQHFALANFSSFSPHVFVSACSPPTAGELSEQVAEGLSVQDGLSEEAPGGESAMDHLNGRDLAAFAFKTVCSTGGIAVAITINARAKREKRRKWRQQGA